MKILGARQWLRHSVVYAFGIGCQSALALFVVPIYTRRLPPREYGILELLNRSQEFLALFVMTGLATAVIAFYQFEAGNEGKQKSVFSTALTAVLFNSFALWLFLLPVAPNLARVVLKDGSYAWAVRAFLLLLPLELLFQIGLVALQAQYKSGLFVIFSVGRFGVGLVTNIVLVLWLKMGIAGVIISMLAHTGLAALATSIYLFGSFGWKPRWDLWTAMLRYGSPFVIGGLLRIVLDSGDRYFLIALRDAATVGVYAISYKLVLAMSTLVLMPFAKVWGASMIHIGNAPDGAPRIARAMTYLTGIYLYIGLLISLMSPAIIRWFTGPQYWEAYKPVPLLIFAYLFFGQTLVADTAFYAKKKTHWKPWLLAPACAVCFSLYWVLIPRWGAMGAAYATVGGFAAFALVTVQVSQRILRVRYESKRLASLIGLAALMFALCRLIVVRFGAGEVLTTAIAALMFPVLLRVSGLLAVDERGALAKSISEVRAFLVRTPAAMAKTAE